MRHHRASNSWSGSNGSLTSPPPPSASTASSPVGLMTPVFAGLGAVSDAQLMSPASMASPGGRHLRTSSADTRTTASALAAIRSNIGRQYGSAGGRYEAPVPPPPDSPPAAGEAQIPPPPPPPAPPLPPPLPVAPPTPVVIPARTPRHAASNSFTMTSPASSTSSSGGLPPTPPSAASASGAPVTTTATIPAPAPATATGTSSTVRCWQWRLVTRPNPMVTTDCFEKVAVDNPDPSAVPEGHVLVRPRYVSVDPYLRGQLNPPTAEHRENFEVGQAISSVMVSVVLVAPAATSFRTGDCVIHHGTWTTVQLVPVTAIQKIDTSLDLRPSWYLGILGLPGIVAFCGVKQVACPRPGDVVLVSAMGGCVGNAVAQLFRTWGCHVIGCTGTDKKVSLLLSMGLTAFNYKSPDAREQLMALAPTGIDIFWDNVGGLVLDTVLPLMRTGGRVIMCGAISQTNISPSALHGHTALGAVIAKQLRLQGISAHQFATSAPEAVATLAEMILTGKLEVTETSRSGFDALPSALVQLFEGQNFGKMVVRCE